MKKPIIGIIMGSDTDLPIMKESAEILDKFGILYEISIISAHRTPTRAFQYAQSAEKKGLEVIIAGAGGAAHLPGVIAALTSLPVIGIPIQSKSLTGLDSLLSIVQMPSGVPVATVGINNATNAGLLAIQILGRKYPAIGKKIKKYKKDMEKKIQNKARRLEKLGYQKYQEK